MLRTMGHKPASRLLNDGRDRAKIRLDSLPETEFQGLHLGALGSKKLHPANKSTQARKREGRWV